MKTLSLILAAALAFVAAAAPAATVTVTTTVDVVDGNTSSVAAITATPGGAGISLREAVLAVNNDAGGPHIISIPAGTYTLTIAGLDDTAAAGDLDVRKAVTITGAGSATTIIRAGTTASNGIDKIFSCNPLGNLPGFPVTMSGFTLRFGRNVDTSVAGGNNVGGGMDFDAGFGANFNGLGNLTMTDVIVDQCATTNGDAGGLGFFDGGTMTLTNCQFTNNRAVSNTTTTVLGGGIGVGFANGHATNYTFNNCTITGNSTAGTTPADGGGFNSFAGGMNFHGCTISNNTANGASSDGGGIRAVAPLTIDQGTIITGNTATRWGGGIVAFGTGISISNTTITNNTGSANGAGGVGGGGIFVGGINGTATVSNCRITGNVSPIGGSQVGCQNGDGATVNAINNWFGTNAPPASFFGVGVTANPFLVLAASASPTTINTGQSSTLTATITRNSNAQTGFTVPNVTPITFAGVLGAMSPTSSTMTSGSRTSTFTAGGAGGSGSASATVDSQTLSAGITINQPPAITSANSTTFVVGTNGSFTVAASGVPAPTLSMTGTLPTGVTFTPGTGALSGTPGAGTGGTYPLTFTATSGAGSTTQNFTLTVNQAPAITSANSTTFTEGASGTFTVTRTGFPAPTLSMGGTLPTGVTFTAASGVLSGTPGPGTGGNYNLTFTASNGVGSNATQNFTLTVQGRPVVGNVSKAATEDVAVAFAAGDFTTGSYSDPNGDALATVRITSLPANGVLKNGAAVISTVPTDIAIANIGNLTYTSNLNYNGPDSFGWNGSDGTLFAASGALVNVTVAAVNDKPTFTAANPPTVNEDAGAQTVVGWVTAFSAGPANESGQTVLGYLVSAVGTPGLFSTLPAVANDGTLTYTPAANANGTSTFTVRVQDNGGVASGGTDTSDPQTFTITVNAVNDKPNFTAANPPASNEDAGAQTVVGWVTAFAPGPNEAGQTVLACTVTNVGTPALFSTLPAVATNGTLTYTAAANANGTSTFTVRVQDNGGTANSGVDTSDPQTFTITVNAVNDNPVAGADSIERYPTQSTKVRVSVLLANDTDPDGDTPLAITAVGAAASGQATVTMSGGYVFYQPNAGFIAGDTFAYTLSDGHGGTAFGTVTVTIHADNTQAQNITKMEILPGGTAHVVFGGIPGRSYRVQSTDSLSPTNWTVRATVVADAQGKIDFTDPPPLPPQRYYRTIAP